ncbi:hypothetical protein ABT173_42185 [Streptomyces sp. NPDC001795]|uniref:WD40 repeat domain-containing protein n=1 Tax=unclassified Streptomyces TaxID=2593676 RepID=UPI003319FDD3
MWWVTPLATGSTDRSVRLWGPTTRRPVGEPLTGHQSAVHAVAFSPDGTLLVTASTDRVRRWAIRSDALRERPAPAP